MRFDVAVIGGGIAGTAAALAATALGARAAVVRAGPGVTGLCSGAWAGPMSEPIGSALRRAGIPHESCEQPLPHPAGEYRACTFAPAWHASALVDGDTLVCGIAGLPGFHAATLARLWADGRTVRSTARGGQPMPVSAAPPVGVPVRHATLALERTPAAGWSSVSLAALLDRDPALLAVPLARAVRESGAQRVVLPAVLGIERTAAVRARLAELAGVDVAEALSGPPSLPGWRLAGGLQQLLRDAGVEIIDGRALRQAAGNSRSARAAPGKRRVGSVHVNLDPHGRGYREVAAKCFVLATGKFAGGGIAATHRLFETTFGLPVRVEHLGRRFTAPHPLALTHAERGASQPILSAGVRADADSRPLDENGHVVYEDVVVAGSVRAGFATELPLGDAARDGWRAGELAARIAA